MKRIQKQMATKITNIRPAGAFDQVVTVEGGKGCYRKTPCKGCPWVKENAGSFPPDAFKHSANTAHDMSNHRFGCHESGAEKPATCAGFLLRGADHNLAIRLDILRGRINPLAIHDDGRELFRSYRDMAVENGVREDDPAIAACR